MVQVEQSSQGATKIGAKDVDPDGVIIAGASLPGSENSLSEADSGVKSGTSVASAKSDVGQKRDANGPGQKVTFSRGSGNRVLNHQDLRDEQERAESFGQDSATLSVIQSRSKSSNSAGFLGEVPLPKANVCKHDTNESTRVLSNG